MLHQFRRTPTRPHAASAAVALARLQHILEADRRLTEQLEHARQQPDNDLLVSLLREAPDRDGRDQ